MLTASQCRQFREEGYVCVNQALERDIVDELREATSNLVSRFDLDAHRTVFKTSDRDAGRDDIFFRSAETVEYFLEEEALDASGQLLCDPKRAINKIGHALHDKEPAFTQFCRQGPIGHALRQLGQTDPQVCQTMLIFKQPGIGGEVRWHQDASYLHSAPESVVGVWLALEDAHQGNGCLWVAPGAHKGPLRERYRVDWALRKGHLETLDTSPWPDFADAQALEVPAGSLVFFSDLMPHYSSANRSDDSRLAFTLHSVDGAAEWSESNWLQRKTLPPFLI